MQVISIGQDGREEVITYRDKTWYHENGRPLTQQEIASSPVFKKPPNQPKPFSAKDREEFIRRMRGGVTQQR